MNRRNVVPNRNTAPAATVLNRAIASSFPSKMFDIADCRPCASPTALVVWQPPIQPGRWWG
jgi:hypothetical protein